MTGSFESDARREAATSWFLRLRGDGCSAAERAAFEGWQTDPRNAAAYAAVEAAWGWAGDGAASHEIRALREEARRLGTRPLPWRGIAAILVGAAVLGAAGTAFWSLARAPTNDSRVASAPKKDATPPQAAAYSTAIGERSTVTFGDGSVIFLNTNSRLEADYTTAERDVLLVQGQALFEVAHDPDRPFVVTAGGRRVTAIGTAFDVRLEADSLQVTLIEGRVRVEDRDEPPGEQAGERAELEAGQQFVDSAVAGVEVRRAPVARITSWREGRLIFEDEPLGDAIEEMNRYSTTRIVLSEPTLERLRVSGVFNTGQTRNFVEALVAYFPITVSPASHEDRIVLAPMM